VRRPRGAMCRVLSSFTFFCCCFVATAVSGAADCAAKLRYGYFSIPRYHMCQIDKMYRVVEVVRGVGVGGGNFEGGDANVGGVVPEMGKGGDGIGCMLEEVMGRGWV